MRFPLALAAGVTACLTLVPALVAAGAAAAPAPAAACSPVTTPAQRSSTVPSPARVLGYELGSRPVTDLDIGTFMTAVDRASDRVVTGTFARSWQDRPLRYALVGSSATLARRTQISADLAAIRDPATPDATAADLIARTPDVLWITANVHGNEPSGSDAVLRVLYDLASRSDCVAKAILGNSLVGLIPTQNPDGRAANTRTNDYAFDMNRDWFARTQPETAGKLDLLWQYPPQLYVDEHEMGGSNYFFPPNSDPIYHETPDVAYDEIANLYGRANAAAFDAKGFGYETYESGYDLFYQGYGDTVPTTQFGAAGMTYEQGSKTPYPKRVLHQYTSAWVSLYTGATHRQQILTRWRGIFSTALAEGRKCRLEPNATFNPGNTVLRPVPDAPVCGYFLRGDDRDTRTVVRRLQQAHVEVRRLTQPFVVADYRAYGSSTAQRTTLPRGTYWISMAQAQKHWVQAMLNADTFVPFPYFYDLSAWSNPLLSGLDGGWTGTATVPAAKPVPLLPAVGRPALPAKLPRIAIVDQRPEPTYQYQTTGWLRWRMDRDWKVPYTAFAPGDITAASLADVDVMVVPDVDVQPSFDALGAAGRSALKAWVAAGGRYVGWQGGTALAGRLGLSSATVTEAEASSPGALLSINSPYPHDYALWEDYDGQMSANGAAVVASFPAAPFTSGYIDEPDTLAGSAIEAVDLVGSGSVTVFSIEPNLRAYTDGTAKLLLDAVLATPVPNRAAAAAATTNVAGPPLEHTPAQHRAHDEAGRD
ncbi:M14 family zinc carboxypeptidase [Jatrophihabitans sp. YIM 134969]